MARATAVPDSEPGFAGLLQLLRHSTGVDFSGYKPVAIRRRIHRRMGLKKIETLIEYLRCLRRNPAEVQALFQDMLIGVTGFFRDPQTFESLKKIAFPKLFKDRAPNDPVRVWVPGCSTGEEVYSHVICLLEYLSESNLDIPLQVYGTDLNESAIKKAKIGIFKTNITADVSPERLKRFFTKIENGYQVNKSIRNPCIFAQQNVISDPPFSRMDIVSCRNLLIYLGPAAQRRVTAVLHYALKPKSYLMLGKSEALVGSGAELFEIADEKNCLYIKKPMPSPVMFAVNKFDAGRHLPQRNPKTPGRQLDTIRSVADTILLARYSPPAVVVNEKLEIVQTRGNTSPYLKLPPQQSPGKLYGVAQPGVLPQLQKAVETARKGDVSIAEEQLEVSNNGNLRHVNLDVIPFKVSPGPKTMYLVVFNKDIR